MERELTFMKSGICNRAGMYTHKNRYRALVAGYSLSAPSQGKKHGDYFTVGYT
jgi:hypothetical protein